MIRILMFAYILISSSALFAANDQVWKVTYSVLDSEKAAAFCEEVLGLIRIPIPDETLAKGRAWVKFPNSTLELHFVEAQPWRYGYQEIKEAYAMIDELDLDMSIFTTFMDNHAAIMVDDLDPYLNKLQAHQIPFMGPIRRDDGVYQLYFEIPGHLYLELDSRKKPTFDKVLTWKAVDFGKRTQ